MCGGAKLLEEALAGERRPVADCPRPGMWWDPSTAARFLDHAAECPRCAMELRAAIETSPAIEEGGPASPEGDAARAQLAAKMAVGWARGPALVTRKPTRAWQWLGIAAALVAVGSGIVWKIYANSTRVLIAEAYRDQRTVEFRLPGAAYAPLRVSRGAGEPNNSIPMLEARARAARGLQSNPDSPSLLEESARIDLLNWNYAAAFPLLARASELRPNDSDILEDLALAHFERAEKDPDERAADYEAAVESLSRILNDRPNDAAALFNRAIALERILHFREAKADWEHLLQIEPNGPWAAEARDRLAAVNARLQSRFRERKPCDSLTAAIVADWGKRGELPRQIEAFEGGWACLRERALVDWLPDPGRFADALTATASSFREVAGDTWFSDVLRGAHTPGFATAARSLSESAAANLAMEAGRGEQTASEAESLFEEIGNRAGVAQAAIEFGYAIQRLQQPQECRSSLSKVERSIISRSWTWARLQQRLDASACFSLDGDQGAAKLAIREVIAQTEGPVFSSLHLRALSYLEMAERLTGDYDSAWKYGVEGLRIFWSGRQPAVWGYQLYYHLARGATAVGESRLALLSQRETLAEVQMAGRPRLEAFGWFDYGRAAMLAGSSREARNAFATAERKFHAMTLDRALLATLADCDVYMAELENQEGQPAAALDRLARAEPQFTGGNAFPMSLYYYRAIAQADKLLGRRAKYETDLGAVKTASDTALTSLRTFREQGRWARESGDTYREIAELLALEKQQPATALDSWEAFRASGSAPALPAAATFHKLGISQALIYLAIDDRLLIWLVKDGTVTIQIVPVKRTRLAALARKFYQLCSEPASTDTERTGAGQELARYLIAPVENSLSADAPLWVEPDDAIASVPFPALPLRSSEPAGVRYRLAIFPSVSSLDRTALPGSADSWVPALVAGISRPGGEAAANLLPLPGAAEEARQVAQLLPTTAPLVDGEATLEAMRRDLPRAVVFHFAGHAISSADKVALLLPGEPGELTADEIASMNLKQCRLAVLSVCSAETPGLDSGRTFGLALALMRAGASGVLATRWDLDSRTAGLYMQTFYRRLLLGDSAVSAAHAAAMRIRATPGFDHPYFWAAYQYFGRA